MIINFSPVRMDEQLMMDREGDIVMLNGVEFDFSQLPEGATLPREAIDSPWFAGPVKRVEGELVLTIVLPHGPDADEATRFPEPITMTEDGTVDLPVWGPEALEDEVIVEVGLPEPEADQ